MKDENETSEVIGLKFKTAFKLYVVLVMLGLTVLLVVTLSSCTEHVVESTFTFNVAIIRLPDGSIVEGEVDDWKEYSGDIFQIKLTDGTSYLIHSSNVSLIHE